MKSIAQKIVLFLALAAFTTTGFAQTGQVPTQSNQAQQVEVTDAELEKFAEAFQRMRMLNQQAQQRMMQLVQEEGMEVQRFNEIHQAAIDPEVEVELTEEEMEKYQEITSEIQEMQEEFRQQMEDIVSNQDLSLEKYEQIATQLQNDPELQERLRAVFQD